MSKSWSLDPRLSSSLLPGKAEARHIPTSTPQALDNNSRAPTLSHNATMATMIAVLKRFSSPPPQILHSLQPTPSTVSYTVSTRRVSTTLPAILAFHIGIAARILVGASALVLLWTKWLVSSARSTVIILWICGRAGEDALVELVESLPWRYLAPSTLLLIWFVLQRGYKGRSCSILPLRDHANVHIRRIPHCPSRPRPSDVHHVFHISSGPNYAFYTDHKYPRYLHTRGVQGLRSPILLSGGGERGGRCCGGVP